MCLTAAGSQTPNPPKPLRYLGDWEAVVPLAGLEPACLAAFDFESNASTNFATGAAKTGRLAGHAAHRKGIAVSGDEKAHQAVGARRR